MRLERMASEQKESQKYIVLESGEENASRRKKQLTAANASDEVKLSSERQ